MWAAARCYQANISARQVYLHIGILKSFSVFLDLFTPEELVSIEKALLAAGPSFLATLGRNTSAPHNSGGPAGQGSVIAYGGQYSGPGAPQMKQPPPYNPSCQAGSAVPHMMMRPAEAATGRPSQLAQQTLMGRVVPQYPRHLVGQQPHKQTQQTPPTIPLSGWSAMPQTDDEAGGGGHGRPSQPAQQTSMGRGSSSPAFSPSSWATAT
ncbi:Hypothetical predicted protein [Cloeon dipterum]|uniref:Uncharacterized protein n=1 Tax=Cloeon dipterum TaxID=197152 RepID=A0A8S1C5V8_9INSE|nr:Hypothetical predicted protein [Cloeon dipterum]